MRYAWRLLRKQPSQRLGYATDVAAVLEGLGALDGPGGPEPRAYVYRPAFVGRQPVLEALDEPLQRLEAGGSGLVLVNSQ